MDERERRDLYVRVAKLEQQMEAMKGTATHLVRLFWATLLIVGFTAASAIILQMIQHA